ncbi:monovalent cation/H+ antiporter subunit E [Halorubellus sp. JP-L1]|uniref:monovalent cation/H+ antiporter subunit E n=1 Tax=Halorubellus sp. JP-L1 TaxID=2715753 RepID=UPI00140A29A8|nr:monovalent cation/H+ antiporter subunit E [Halorubellus sp. JP-L1]
MSSARILVPVSESTTLRNTVAHAIDLCLEDSKDRGDSGRPEKTDGPEETDVREDTDGRKDSGVSKNGDDRPTVHFVYPVSERLTYDVETTETREARDLLDRVTVWAEEDLGDDAASVAVETALVGTREYLFSPGDYAGVLAEYATAHDLSLAVFDPGFNPLGTTPLLPPLEAEVERAGLEVQKAPVQRERRSPLLVRSGTIAQFLALFGVSFLFYLLLAGSVATFELATGAISAGIVAVSLWGISLTTPVKVGRMGRQLARFAVYVPYLLWEIVVANVQIAYVVLHPSLPIDPEVVEFDAAVWSALPVTTLANSITLTPGTLTVDVSRRHFTVHTLTGNARDALFEGKLERAVRFVFYGRAASRIPSPAERAERSEGDE